MRVTHPISTTILVRGARSEERGEGFRRFPISASKPDCEVTRKSVFLADGGDKDLGRRCGRVSHLVWGSLGHPCRSRF